MVVKTEENKLIDLKIGDKIKLINPIGIFTNVGEICEVTDVSEDGMISFIGKVYLGCMSADKFNNFFEKYEPKSLNVERIEEVMNNSKVTVQTLFEKCTVVAVKLPCGHVIVESSSCIDKENYNEEIGVEICMNRIKDRVVEMEAYAIQSAQYQNNKNA